MGATGTKNSENEGHAVGVSAARCAGSLRSAAAGFRQCGKRA